MAPRAGAGNPTTSKARLLLCIAEIEGQGVLVRVKDQLPRAEGVALRRVEGLLRWPRLPSSVTWPYDVNRSLENGLARSLARVLPSVHGLVMHSGLGYWVLRSDGRSAKLQKEEPNQSHDLGPNKSNPDTKPQQDESVEHTKGIKGMKIQMRNQEKMPTEAKGHKKFKDDC
ncbi:hypothetical protein RHMOL_Rhmol13G0175900 [Rhododendron molle]|uniref:Uncharacterized protein n=1 Tax=Rhododendron molle TaxID=49168 RepID=A0ACC0L964_RHOML|nr:hypothetical protein RHMOL_Rhmol13G0175900 [Rhododendron molle]